MSAFSYLYEDDSLVSFSLQGQSLKLDSEEDIAKHLKPLTEEPLKSTVQLLDLSGNTIGIPASKYLGEVLAGLPSLKVVNFADLFTGRLKDEIPQSLQLIFAGLLQCPQLTTVDLSDNAFGLMAIDPLEDFLSRHAPLQHLIMSNNGFGPFAGARLGQSLVKLAEHKKSVGVAETHPLLTVVCGRNRLENGSMEKWAEYLTAHPQLEKLFLFQNGIRQEGIETLMLEGLATCRNLKVLNLEDNTFTAQGAKALARIISTFSDSLEELAIGDCLLGPKGSLRLFQKIVEGKITFPQLKTLKLTYNEINKKGFAVFIDALKQDLFPALKTLEINGNVIPEDDDLILELRDVFEGEIDELEDMEEEDSEAEEESETETEEEEELTDDERAALVKDDELAEDANVPRVKDEEVEKLAEKLEKTEI